MRAQALKELLESDDKFGFIIMDGNGSLFATLNGNHREILHKMSVELPKKHGARPSLPLAFRTAAHHTVQTVMRCSMHVVEHVVESACAA